MNGKGCICIERFWISAKCERIYLNEYQSILELMSDVDDYIEFYNHRRSHEILAYNPNPKIEPPNLKNTNQNPKKPPHSSLASIKIQTIPPI